METITKQLYEGMFLVDVAKASSDFDGVVSAITKILERSEAEIVSIKKWDDRKLAYDIKGQSRGVYILCYFKVDGTKIHEIEKNMRLSEQVMRLLILNAELMSQEDINKETPAAKAELEGSSTVEDSDDQVSEKDSQEDEEQDLESQETDEDDQEEEVSQEDTDSDEDKQA